MNWMSFCFILKTKRILLFTFDGHHNFDKFKQCIGVNGDIGISGALNRLEEIQLKSILFRINELNGNVDLNIPEMLTLFPAQSRSAVKLYTYLVVPKYRE